MDAVFSLKFPDGPPGNRFDGMELSVQRGEVKDAIAQHRSGTHRAFQPKLPAGVLGRMPGPGTLSAGAAVIPNPAGGDRFWKVPRRPDPVSRRLQYERAGGRTGSYEDRGNIRPRCGRCLPDCDPTAKVRLSAGVFSQSSEARSYQQPQGPCPGTESPPDQ